MQDLGSALAYARRYTASCLLFVASDEDDDANLADGNEAKASPRKAPAKAASAAPAAPPVEKASAAQVAEVREALVGRFPGEGKDPEVQKARALFVGKACGRMVERLSDLTPGEAMAVLAAAAQEAA